MRETKQASLTAYYSARKATFTPGVKHKGKETTQLLEKQILRTPKSDKVSRSSSSECQPVPSKRRRLSSAYRSPCKTPAQGVRDAANRDAQQLSARKRLYPQDGEVSNNKAAKIERTTKGADVSTGAASSGQGTSSERADKLENALKFDKVDMLQKLKASGKLGDLKEKLDIIQKTQNQLAELRLKKEQRKPSTESPAFVKYDHLTESGPPSLTLPYSYKVLNETFRCCDTVVSMLFNRKEICTFEKLKQSVEEMQKKRFGEKQLGQIKRVYPNSYEFAWEKVNTRGSGSNCLKLVITPLFYNATKRPETLSAVELLKRRKVFNCQLLAIVKRHHDSFLSKLDPPMAVPSELLTRWHPKFPLETIPEIEPAALPRSPQQTTCSSAKDVLDRFKGKMNERIEKALESIVQSRTDPTPVAEPTPSALKGVSADLLERIRQRETLKLVKEMTMKPETERERAQLSHLPEFIRIVRSLFLAEQKAALPRDELLRKVRDSYSTLMSEREVEALAEQASKVLPDWFKVLAIKRGVFVKIAKDKDVSDLVSRVKNKLNE
ncbi:DNA replication factor Cdt1-like [Ornithodoros turicata]|uniref:DNA replication factor Cdt1-like n=1 Tax=Ornithodoros turicata TaxID=34597 RepID=UPI003138A31B